MCMGGGNDAANQARHNEMRRQGRVQQGLGQINSIFDGGMYGTGATSNYQDGMKYYTSTGQDLSTIGPGDKGFDEWAKAHNVFGNSKTSGPPEPRYDPVASVIFGNSDDRPGYTVDQAKKLYGKYLATVNGLFTGKSTTPGFGQDFYNQRARDYQAYAMPQLGQQIKQQGDALSYRLANQGLLGSGAGGKLAQSFQGEVGKQTRGVVDAGIGQAQELRGNVENKRSQLISQLEATGDPTTASQLALSSASQFQAPSVFQPVGNLFGQWAQQYMNYQNAQQYNPMLTMMQQRQYGYSGQPLGSSYSIKQ